MDKYKDLESRLDRLQAQINPLQKDISESETEFDWEAEAASGRCFVEVRNEDDGAWIGPFIFEEYDYDPSNPFHADGDWWKQARIITVPGIWRNWYGGECPANEPMHIKHRDGSYTISANPVLEKGWQHHNCDNDIIAFCVLP